MRTYEVLFITRPDYDEEKVASIIARYQDVIASGNGTLKTSDKWGKRRLAYEIDGLREGLYILMTFEGPPSLSAEIDRLMKIDQDVVRHMISRIDNISHKLKGAKARPKAKAEELKIESDQEKREVSVVREEGRETSADIGPAQAEQAER
ncbi:MAG: 30S ribosomal protein S6 [Candidatus Fermentithermobacillus carboniphilus]|uniref:Small ribosomal subunit protein bS6 n=1 Tax=Candidatus Fermentithermobacillus carboniphilus TaxID=3085328 RepID=A0AAT9LA09_9FIRM|nr:MAG: 30S ribosomal protein S6 [Candidatus Fermentithermobacillus carboniphilus]